MEIITDILTGFNELNYDHFYGDTCFLEDRHVHPNNVGYERMGSLVVSFLENN